MENETKWTSEEEVSLFQAMRYVVVEFLIPLDLGEA